MLKDMSQNRSDLYNHNAGGDPSRFTVNTYRTFVRERENVGRWQFSEATGRLTQRLRTGSNSNCFVSLDGARGDNAACLSLVDGEAQSLTRLIRLL